MFSQYFPPEAGATQTRMHHFAERLAESGHDVTVITQVPNHPKGVIFPGYRRRVVVRREEHGFSVIRVWVYTSTAKSFLNRLLYYFSFLLNAVIAGVILARGHFDLVFATSPPLFSGLAGMLVAKAKRRPFVLDIRDIWPDIAVELGELTNPRVIAGAKWVEARLYRSAAEITCVTKMFIEDLAGKGVNRNKLHHLPNGTIPEVFNPQLVDRELRGRIGVGNSFVVGFCGNHGIAQDLPNILRAAALLRKQEDLYFLFVGEGPVKSDLLAMKVELGLERAIFVPEVPLRSIAGYINACDLMLVTLAAKETFKAYVPSKLFDFLACARPVILTVDGEARAILEESGGGVFVPAGDPSALAQSIQNLRRDHDRLRQMGMAGHDFVCDQFTRDQQAVRLGEILERFSK